MGKVGKNDAKFQIYEPFELENLFFIGILKRLCSDYIYEVFLNENCMASLVAMATVHEKI